MNFIPMLSKELKEMARSYRLLFVPIVFALLSLSQPIAIKLLPRIMEGATNLPPGAKIEIPIPPPDQVVAGVIGQLNQMGILVVVLAAMGAIAGERISGVAATVLTKPVSRSVYLAAKVIAHGVLAMLSTFLGIGLGAYYTQVLIGPVTWGNVGTGALLYLPNVFLAAVVTICFSAFLPSPVAAGGAGLSMVIVLNVVPRYLGKFLASVGPGALTEAAVRVLAGSGVPTAQPVLGVLLLILVVLSAGWFALERQEI